MRIELHIDRVVLDGIPASSRDAAVIRDALHAELSTLVTASLPRTCRQSIRQRRVAAPTLRFNPAAPPAVLGRGIAVSVYNGLAAAVAPQRGGAR